MYYINVRMCSKISPYKANTPPKGWGQFPFIVLTHHQPGKVRYNSYMYITEHSARCALKKMILLSSITTPQDVHKRLVLQVYLGSDTLEFSAIASYIGKNSLLLGY